LTGPFVLRLVALSKPEYDLLSPKITALLEEKTPRFNAWAQKLVQEDSVTYIWDEQKVAARTKARFAKMAAEKRL